MASSHNNFDHRAFLVASGPSELRQRAKVWLGEKGFSILAEDQDSLDVRSRGSVFALSDSRTHRLWSIRFVDSDGQTFLSLVARPTSIGPIQGYFFGDVMIKEVDAFCAHLIGQ